MDLSKLTTAQKIAVGAGVVLVINLFLPWYRISAGGFSVSANAFDAGFLAWFGSLLGMAGAVLIAMKALGSRETAVGKLKTEQIALLLGGLGVVLILLRFITETSNLFLGIFLGIIACGAVTYGAFTAMKDAGLSLPTADDFKSVAGGDDE